MGYDLDLERDLIPKLDDLRQEMSALSVDEISFNFSVRVYEDYLTSLVPLVLEKGMPIYGRAAAYHNHLIKKNNNQKYALIRSGSKIKFYYAAPNEHDFDIFAYAPGAYPEEIAVPMDRSQQFFRLLIEPINKLLVSMGYPELTADLSRRVEIIKSRSRKKEFTDDETFPLFAVNSTTLEYSEIPASCQEYVGNPDMKVPPEIFPVYLSSISKFGLDTVIVPKHELQKYRERIAKKTGIQIEDPFAATLDQMVELLVGQGWTEVSAGSWAQSDKYLKYVEKGKDHSSLCVSVEEAYKKAVKTKKKVKAEDEA